MHKKISRACIVASIAMLVLSGCGSSDSGAESKKGESLKAVEKDDYASYLPYKSSDSSQKHATTTTDLSETFTIGNSMMELSKEHFSPSKYTFREGEYLSFDTLDAASDNSTGMLGRYDKTNNSIGLNPEVGTEFSDEDGNKLTIAASDVLLIDIYEFDWYNGDDLSGISLAFVLNDEIGSENNTSTISKAKMEIYAQETVRKAVSYLRKKAPEIGSDLPIYVALYNTASTDDTLPGTFYRDVYFKKNIDGTFNDVDEKWYLFATSTAADYDSTTSSNFDRYKKSFKEDIMPYDVSMIAKGHYMDGSLKKLTITVTLHARSSGEVKTAIQFLNEKLSYFETSYDIVVDINSDNTHAAVIKREKGSKTTTVISLV